MSKQENSISPRGAKRTRVLSPKQTELQRELERAITYKEKHRIVEVFSAIEDEDAVRYNHTRL